MSPAKRRPPNTGSEPGAPRRCTRCGNEVASERHESEDAITWIWRCPCGWGSARTDSGVISRGQAREAILAAMERAGSSDD